jgi:type IV pilus assembly protein PilC
MTKFEVKVLNKYGQQEDKIIEADDKSAVFSSLKRDGLRLVSLNEKTKSRGINLNFKELNERFSTVKERDKILFARNLGAMIEAGLPVSRAIFVIKKQTKNPKFNAILGNIEINIKKGNSISSSLSKHSQTFPNIFVSMVKAGEEGGSLTDSLKTVADQMEKVYLLKKKIKGALMYPGIILSAVFIIGILMLTFVVPTLTETFKELDIDLPLSTRIVILVSDFMKNHTIVFMGSLIILIISFYLYIKTPKGKRNLDFVLLRTPLISELVKETNAARTARTLSALLSSGVEVVSALSITREVIQNSYYKDVLKESEEKVQKGITLSEIFSEHDDVYPIFISEMISVGEETGKLSDMLSRVALFYEEDIDQKTKNMSTIIEPFLMIFIGIIVGFFALAMITPTYSLVDGL